MGSITNILVVVLLVALFHTSLSVKDDEAKREDEDRSYLQDFSRKLRGGNFHNIPSKMKIIFLTSVKEVYQRAI